MLVAGAARELLRHEAASLLTRLSRLEPFALNLPMASAAAPEPRALRAIDLHLLRVKRELRAALERFAEWLDGEGSDAPAHLQQQRFVFLRMRFNAVLTDLDVFADALAQRSEHSTGTRLGGLDVLARDALSLSGLFEPPPLICYLDRGVGAAIRRARTRLPTGGNNPVAIVRVPRERMVGTAIGSSLLHEVGHQAAAMLGLVESLRPVLRAIADGAGDRREVWSLWERWISEIVADLWAVSRAGITGPLGLLAVVSLPRYFVFRVNAQDPHPVPWIRVRLACAFGDALYPDPQWRALADSWADLYPPQETPEHAQVLRLDRAIPPFVRVVLQHRPRSLGGRTLHEALTDGARTPRALRQLFAHGPRALERAVPTVALAALGQARADGALPPRDEHEVLSALLTQWAVRRALVPRQPPAPRLEALTY